MATARPRPQRGFTLIELMVVLALIVIVLMLAAPSFSSFIVQQRLKSTNAALVTDFQFARSEAVSRSTQVRMRFQTTADESPSTLSCYIIFAEPTPPAATPDLCDCKKPEGTRCPATLTELRTVQLPSQLSVGVQPALPALSHFAFDPRSGGLEPLPASSALPPSYEFAADTFIDTARKFRNMLSVSGRLKVCIPTGSTMAGEAC